MGACAAPEHYHSPVGASRASRRQAEQKRASGSKTLASQASPAARGCSARQGRTRPSLIGPHVCATFTVRTVAAEEPLATLQPIHCSCHARGRSGANAAMSDEVVNVIKETAEVLADAVINVVDAAPRPSRRRPPRRGSHQRGDRRRARGDRETVPEVIKETVAAAAAIEPGVVVARATRVYNYVVTCVAAARTRNLHRHRVAAVWARVAALVAPPRAAAVGAAAADGVHGRRSAHERADVARARQRKTANGPRRAHLRQG